jgi:hypothetical protein
LEGNIKGTQKNNRNLKLKAKLQSSVTLSREEGWGEVLVVKFIGKRGRVEMLKRSVFRDTLN